jgi:hypothetical protein
MQLTRLLAGALAFTSLTACSSGPSAPAPPSAAPAPQPVAQVAPPSPVIAWLDCVECGPELKALVAQRDGVVPELQQVLFKGPSADRIAANEQHLKNTYGELKKYEQRRADRKVPFTEQEYVQRYQQAFILRNRSRAAAGLGAIGTPAARAVLIDAFKLDLPEEVRRDVERAIKSSEKPIPNPDMSNPDVTNPTPSKPPPDGKIP